MTKRVVNSSQILSKITMKIAEQADAVAKGKYDKEEIKTSGDPTKLAEELNTLADDLEKGITDKKAGEDAGVPPTDNTTQVAKKEDETLPADTANEVVPATAPEPTEPAIVPHKQEAGNPPAGEAKTASEKMYDFVVDTLPGASEKVAGISPGAIKALGRILPVAAAGGAGMMAGKEVEQTNSQGNDEEIFQMGMEIGAQQLAQSLMAKFKNESPEVAQ